MLLRRLQALAYRLTIYALMTAFTLLFLSLTVFVFHLFLVYAGLNWLDRTIFNRATPDAPDGGRGWGAGLVPAGSTGQGSVRLRARGRGIGRQSSDYTQRLVDEEFGYGTTSEDEDEDEDEAGSADEEDDSGSEPGRGRVAEYWDVR